MPNYLYSCENCNYTYEQFFTIANRKEEEKEKCPKCGKKKILLAPSAPGIGDPVKLGVRKLPTTWTDKLVEMKSKHRGSTIKTDRTMSK